MCIKITKVNIFKCFVHTQTHTYYIMFRYLQYTTTGNWVVQKETFKCL